MNTLPKTDWTPVLRTDFSDPAAWEAIRVAIETPSEDDFLANVEYIDDERYRDLTKEQILDLAPEDFGHSIVIVVDKAALASAEQPILVIDLFQERGRDIRVVPSELWSIENNMNLANMDFDDFATHVDADGVFRGF